MKIKYHLIFADEVRVDIKESKEWYNNQQKNLGERFVKDVKSTIKRIVKNPQLFAIKYQKVRMANCSVFPFSRKPYWE